VGKGTGRNLEGGKERGRGGGNIDKVFAMGVQKSGKNVPKRGKEPPISAGRKDPEKKSVGTHFEEHFQKNPGDDSKRT